MKILNIGDKVKVNHRFLEGNSEIALDNKTAELFESDTDSNEEIEDIYMGKVTDIYELGEGDEMYEVTTPIGVVYINS